MADMDQARWGQLLEEYRAQPGAHSQVARRCGCAIQTATKYWNRGGRAAHAKIPIRDIVAAEQDAIRAERQRSRDAAHNDEAAAQGRLDALLARQDEICTRVEDLKLVGLLKMNVVDLITMVSALLAAADLIRVDICDALQGEEMREKIRKNPRLGITVIQQLNSLVKGSTDAAELVIKLERLILGEATERREITFASEAEAAEVIERARAASARRGFKPQIVIDV